MRDIETVTYENIYAITILLVRFSRVTELLEQISLFLERKEIC